MIACSAALLVTVAAAEADEGGRRTQVFEGSGSRDNTSDVVFYLLEGTYRHRLQSSPGCAVAASVFAGEIQPEAFWRDLMQADLSVGEPGGSRDGPNPAGSFEVGRQGWAQLQVGTSEDCSWSYWITGVFLDEGSEPGNPGGFVLFEGWETVLAVLLLFAAIVFLMKVRRPPQPSEPDLPKVRPLR
ncbi:MAG: hypothetical protein GWM93_06835 [Gemmatimonadetes bacterium]|nr:hypothetical protein [Gemmatimonadota bacterium]NIT66392.1 hypothetical protein [Gemmatimonadota bacterium]NIY34969.1 hypothetical protein [Gemmatimonadota bacterium]